VKLVRGNGRRLGIALALSAVATFVLGGCATGTIIFRTAAPSPEYTSTYQAPAPTVIAPLTGRTVEAGSLDHPSIAAKIDNHPVARPQVSLDRTDIVFEELVEGGLTRYVGVWHSNIPELLGPVRSIRPMDPDIISPLGGIVAYSGGQQRFVALMQRAPVFNAVHGQANTANTFFRSSDREAPHNVIVRAQQLVGEHSDLAAPGQQFAFSLDTASSTAAKDGSPTAGINLRFGSSSSPSWVYGGGQGVWLRSQAGVVDTDGSGAQLKAVNVLVVRVPVSNDGGVPKTELVGGGEAWVASGGKTVHGHWSKGSMTDRIRIVDDNGVTIRLAPGNSWIELVPVSGSAEFVAPAQ